jgi:hypothetical protein
MRAFLALFALIVSLGAAQAQEGPADPHENGIQAVISAQISAFQSDDFDTAFTFASPNIRRMFGSSERFGDMVRQGYPMVYRPGSLRFLDVTQRGNALIQRVLVTDADGRIHVLEYEMLGIEGAFVINGVRLVPGQVGA